MPIQKTSKAVIKTARINPTSGPKNANALRVIQELESEGWSFAAIVIDAVNRADGKTPEMFDTGVLTSASVRKILDETLDKFADEIAERIGKGQPMLPTEQEVEQGDGKISPFAKKLANKVRERSQQIKN